MKPKLFIFLFLIPLSLFLAGCTDGVNTNVVKEKVTIFKSPSCGCCEGYGAELRRNGWDVDIKIVQDMSTIRNKYNIPSNMGSCHTAIIGDYFIEGHVPLEAVNKLLAEQPAIDGIALPRMPAGSPGMPGLKTAPFRVYSLTNGQTSNFMEV